MSAVDQITGLIPITLAGGIAIKMTDAAFKGTNGKQRKQKRTQKRTGNRKFNHPGNFSNVGL